MRRSMAGCLLLTVVILASAPAVAHAQGSFRWYFKKKVLVDTLPRDSGRYSAVDTTVVRNDVDKSTSSSETAPKAELTVLADGRSVIRRVVKNTSVWLGPSIGFDAFVKEKETGTANFGILPGVGYGIKWAKKPKPGQKMGAPFLAVDLFVQGALVNDDKSHDGNDAFDIDILPVLTFFNWVSVGYGWRNRVGIDGQRSQHRHLFSFGVHKST